MQTVSDGSAYMYSSSIGLEAFQADGYRPNIRFFFFFFFFLWTFLSIYTMELFFLKATRM